ncbi:hypothetical protein AGMMS49928_11260 [Spirochaetia bacterium]|nr:hypothetical protein AGMMS49928_11260 [Spirochaetia bacterium]
MVYYGGEFQIIFASPDPLSAMPVAAVDAVVPHLEMYLSAMVDTPAHDKL